MRDGEVLNMPLVMVTSVGKRVAMIGMVNDKEEYWSLERYSPTEQLEHGLGRDFWGGCRMYVHIF